MRDGVETPTPEELRLAERVLDRLPTKSTDPDEQALRRYLVLLRSSDPDDRQIGFEGLLRIYEAPANISGNPGEAVPEPLNPGPVEIGLRAKLAELSA